VIGLGTIVNVAVIIAGGLAGTLFRKGIPQRVKDIIMQAIGLSVAMIGISGVLQGIFKVSENGSLDRLYIMTMILSLIIGGVIGEIANIEDKLDKLGNYFQSKFSKNGGSFSEGFVTASLIFCVGAMAIVGALEDGLTGNPGTLFAKSVLDGIMALVLSTTLGIGVAFSSIPILIYQGGITLLAVWIKPWLTPEVITHMSLVGSVLILGIGINLLGIARIKVGNLLPAIFIPFFYYGICYFFI